MSEKTSRHLQQHFKEHIGSQGLLKKKHLEIRNVATSFDMVETGRENFEKLLIFEALFITEIKPSFNTKDKFKSQLKIKILIAYLKIL